MPRYHAIDALFDLQRALEASFDSDWLRSGTADTGSFPPINVFQQGDTLVATSVLMQRLRLPRDLSAARSRRDV
ncbi:MAG TPA: hypothetical protein VFI48_16930 [Hyphomicrobiaceae bacterium]|nr:hypothetical protein [Hyphomicrobiaceae bacterium]